MTKYLGMEHRLLELLAECLRASDEHPDGPMLHSTTAKAIREILESNYSDGFRDAIYNVPADRDSAP